MSNDPQTHRPTDPQYHIYRSQLRHQRILLELLEVLADEPPAEYDTATIQRHATEGSVKFWDGCFIGQLLRQTQPKTILEVGSFLGTSTRWLLENSALWGARVTAVDPNIRHRIFDEPRAILEKLNRQFIPGRLEVVTAFFGKPTDPFYYDYETYTPLRSREYVDSVVQGRNVISEEYPAKFDFIFLDGDHSYESTMDNFKVALQLLNPRGVIAFHDVYSWPGVDQAMHTIAREYGSMGDVILWGKDMRDKPDAGYFDGIFHFQLR